MNFESEMQYKLEPELVSESNFNLDIEEILLYILWASKHHGKLLNVVLDNHPFFELLETFQLCYNKRKEEQDHASLRMILFISIFKIEKQYSLNISPFLNTSMKGLPEHSVFRNKIKDILDNDTIECNLSPSDIRRLIIKLVEKMLEAYQINQDERLIEMFLYFAFIATCSKEIIEELERNINSSYEKYNKYEIMKSFLKKLEKHFDDRKECDESGSILNRSTYNFCSFLPIPILFSILLYRSIIPKSKESETDYAFVHSLILQKKSDAAVYDVELDEAIYDVELDASVYDAANCDVKLDAAECDVKLDAAYSYAADCNIKLDAVNSDVELDEANCDAASCHVELDEADSYATSCHVELDETESYAADLDAELDDSDGLFPYLKSDSKKRVIDDSSEEQDFKKAKR